MQQPAKDQCNHNTLASHGKLSASLTGARATESYFSLPCLKKTKLFLFFYFFKKQFAKTRNLIWTDS